MPSSYPRCLDARKPSTYVPSKKTPFPLPPNVLLVGVIDQHMLVLDSAVDPRFDSDCAPQVGTWIRETDDILADAPTVDSGLWRIEFILRGSGPDHNGEYDSWTDSTWTRLSVEVDTSVDDVLHDEHAAWTAALRAWPCERCGRPSAEHGEHVHGGSSVGYPCPDNKTADPRNPLIDPQCGDVLLLGDDVCLVLYRGPTRVVAQNHCGTQWKPTLAEWQGNVTGGVVLHCSVEKEQPLPWRRRPSSPPRFGGDDGDIPYG